MKLPRDIAGAELARALRAFGYELTRQSGSHLRITTNEGGQHHEVIPNHRPLKPGTLNSILKSVAAHRAITLKELLVQLDL